VNNLIKREGERLAFEDGLKLMTDNSEKYLPLQMFLQAGEPRAACIHFRNEMRKHRSPGNMLGY